MGRRRCLCRSMTRCLIRSQSRCLIHSLTLILIPIRRMPRILTHSQSSRHARSQSQSQNCLCRPYFYTINGFFCFVGNGYNLNHLS
jgi:hypothetical protein